jgi:cytoskeletal protein RodZ
MESLGKYLMSNREQIQFSLEEVAKVLEIKVWYLFAIEQDFFELLPSGGYDRKFLAEYAKYLGLDSEEVIRRYEESYALASISEPLDDSARTQSPLRRITRFLAFVPDLFLLLLFIA